MTSQLPKISIVVPSYNQGEYLGKALQSIFDQDYPNLEVIVMDGGSTDQSVSIIESYCDRLAFWRSHPDNGQAEAINEGISYSTGDLITWLNSDDFYCPNAIWIVAQAFQKYPERGLYIGNGYRFNQKTQEKIPFCPGRLAFNRLALAEGLDYILQPSTFIWKKAWDRVGGINPIYQYGFDWDLFLRIVKLFPVVLINEFLAVSREYEQTKTARGKISRAMELIQIAQHHTGRQITLGSAFYLIGTLMEMIDGPLPGSLYPHLAKALDILKIEMSKSWGGDETFPFLCDPQDVIYLSAPNQVCPIERQLRIAVDLTLLLPGGDNGGSKILTLMLLDGIRQFAPQHRLILIGTQQNHREIKRWMGPNDECYCIETAPLPQKNRFNASFHSDFLIRIVRRFWSHTPVRIRKFLRSAIPGVKQFFKKNLPLDSTTRGFLRDLGADILFCPFTTPSLAEPNIPVVSIFYDLQHLSFPQFFAVQELNRRREQMELLERRADRIICISEYSRQALIRHLNFPDHRIKMIPIGLSRRLQRPESGEKIRILSCFGLKDNSYFFYPANFWPHKNHSALIIAYQMLLADHPECEFDLVFCGSLDNNSNSLRKMVKDFGLSDRVHFLGYVSDKEFAVLLGGCRFMVFPSLFEGFGMPIVEAMTFGKPVLCSGVTSLPEIAGEAAIFFDPTKPAEIKDSIERALREPQRIEELIQRGYLQAKKFDYERMIQEYLKVFSEVAGQAINLKDTRSNMG